MTSRMFALAVPRRALLVLALGVLVAAAAPLEPSMLRGLVWRNIGPFRGGRISAVSGAIGEPGTFYAGLPGGGVWKTTSAGETWFPVFDAVEGVSSVGAVAVAPSDPNIVYVGTGDQVTGGALNIGNGVYRSGDGGKTWTHVGLEGTKRIPSIVVDPRNANVVLAGALGTSTERSDARGVFRSIDGGATWTRTLFVSDSVGVRSLAMAYDRPDVLFAAAGPYYLAPPLSGVWPAFDAAHPAPLSGQLFKSTDGGVTWKELAGDGLPKFRRRVALAVAMNTNAQRVYFITNGGLFRSDDGGATWRQMDATDERIRNGQGGYNCGVFVDPRDPDIVYTFNTSSYKSIDGGATFTGFKGAPGGDDPQAGWIDPTDGRRMILGYDQGAIVSFDRGETWSSWYNQSTEQVYHIAADNSYPYWVYATQQDAGAIRVRSRGNLGAITPLDWSPVHGWEWGTIAPDPLDVNTVYSSGFGLRRISFPSDQWISVSPAANPDLRLRMSLSEPIVWAPWDRHELLAGYQYLVATTDGGAHWKRLSPDLTNRATVTPPPDTTRPVPGTGLPPSIESIAASSVSKGTIWVGTTNGLIRLTQDDGRSWRDVSIPGLPFPGGAIIESIEASHQETGGAYVAVDAWDLGDTHPYLFRTRDFGKSWTPIMKGLPSDEPGGSQTRVIREDPKRAGMLFTGTETGVYISFDDGDVWQSLRLNLPVTSYRDILVKGSDLIVGTYGRGIWILDEFTVLRQMTPAITAEPVHLFKPEPAVRVRRNVGFNTPFPPEVPHALNPPDGVVIYYWLKSRPAGEITLDVTDSAGTLVRHLSSTAPAPVKEAAKPLLSGFWLAPPETLSTAAGTNRAAWDLRYDPPPVFAHSYAINANPGLTPASPVGALAPPGRYTITLTVDGRRYEQPATIISDPRSPVNTAAILAQVALLGRIQSAMRVAWNGYEQATAVNAALAHAMPADSTSALAKSLVAFRAAVDSVAGDAESAVAPDGSPDDGSQPVNFVTVQGRLAAQFFDQDNGDLAPTESMLQGFAVVCHDLANVAARWQSLNMTKLPELNAMLAKNGAPAIPAAAGVRAPKC